MNRSGKFLLAAAFSLLVGVGVAGGTELPVAAQSPTGALVVVGGGGTPPEVVARAIELAGGPDAVIVVLPQASATEAAGASTVAMFREAGARNVANWRFVGSPGTEGLPGPFPSVEETAAAIADADLVWFPGGAQGRLKRALDDAGLTDLIRLRHREGIVIGGTSAGAAVLAEAMITGDEYDLEGVTAASTDIAEGLALWPDALIDQHFLKRQRNNRLLSAVIDHPQLIGVGIDERTAVIVRDGELEVMGDSSVIVFDARDAAVVAVSAGAPTAATGIRTDVLIRGMSLRYRR
ncbi:MAG: cyanophycinase [Acidobacteriota bacterium]|jgi:cyanophycinase